MLAGELDERHVGLVPLSEAQEDWAGADGSAVRVTLEQSLALERGQKPRGRALRKLARVGQLADAERPRTFDYANEQIRSPVDRLRSGHDHIMERTFHRRKSIEFERIHACS